MRKIYKSIAASLLAAAIVVTLPAAGLNVKADALSDAAPEDVYVSFGADLKDDEKDKVMSLMGIEEEDLENYTVGEITNDDEHKYLGDYLDDSVIGTRALSSVVVVVGQEGDGIDVETKNISYCTPGMYTNALITAGIKDADVIVAGPFEITGTAASCTGRWSKSSQVSQGSHWKNRCTSISLWSAASAARKTETS